jgi:hypothetical protein
MNLHVTPLGLAAVGLGWILIACAIATVPHRAKRALRAADPGEDPTPLEDLGEFIEIQRGLPPVPASDRGWLADQPAEILVDAELAGQFYGIVAREWYL